MEWNELDDEPCYVISIAAKLVGVHTQTLRYYERAGLVEPSRSTGNLRLYSRRDLERVRLIKSLTDDLGVNLAGVEVILRLFSQMDQMETRMHHLVGEIVNLHQRLEKPRLPGHTPEDATGRAQSHHGENHGPETR